MPSVMIVDDAKAMREYLAQIVRDMHFNPVIQAKNGAEALAMLHNDGAVEVMLVDINMPEMDGLALVKEVRKRDGWADIKIIMVTTESEMHQVDKAFSLGANGYIMKPFAPKAIKEHIDELYARV